jgi:hypothetical protein
MLDAVFVQWDKRGVPEIIKVAAITIIASRIVVWFIYVVLSFSIFYDYICDMLNTMLANISG